MYGGRSEVSRSILGGYKSPATGTRSELTELTRIRGRMNLVNSAYPVMH